MATDAESAKSDNNRIWIASGVAAVLGAVVWTTTMAGAPRHSQGADLDMGNPGLLLLGLVILAVVVGAVVPRRPWLPGAMASITPLMLAPGTAPQGDGDGLWFYIVPTLIVMTGVTAGTAAFARLMVTSAQEWSETRATNR